MRVLVVLAAFAAMSFAAQIECKSYKDMLSSEGCYSVVFWDGLVTRIYKDGKYFMRIIRHRDNDQVRYVEKGGETICEDEVECRIKGYK